jgi:hypothetical protein
MIFVDTSYDEWVAKRVDRLIYWSAWKVNSPKLDFRFTEFSEVRMQDPA